MKKIVAGMLIILMAVPTFAQQGSSPTLKSKADYLEKSKNQETQGWVLLGVGSAALLASFIVVISAGPSGKDIPTLPDVIPILGLGCVVGSLPLFVASKVNSRKAENVKTGIIIQRNQQVLFADNAFPAFPAVSLQVAF